MDDRRNSGSKRKASFDREPNDDRHWEPSPKRVRHRASPGRRGSGSRSPQRHRKDSFSESIYDEPERKKSASLEEKKRGKRLFGGLLNTLSQTSTNSHQKRRHEIERRQLERQERQKAEADGKKEEMLARLQVVRASEQIIFEDKVMRHKHSKMLWAADHLKTKAKPPIYYSPWKLTKRQQGVVDSQKEETNDKILREREFVKHRQERGAENPAAPLRFTSPSAPGDESKSIPAEAVAAAAAAAAEEQQPPTSSIQDPETGPPDNGDADVGTTVEFDEHAMID